MAAATRATRSRIDSNTSPLERLRWLIEFSELDLDVLTSARLKAAAEEALHLALSNAAVDLPAEADRETALRRLKQLQAFVVEAFNAARAEQNWPLPFTPREIVLMAGSGTETDPKKPFAFLFYKGGLVEMFLFALVNTMTAAWVSTRICEREECRKIFIPDHGRQRFHSEDCANKTRWARRAPGRDYKAEYEARIANAKKPRSRKRA